MPKTVNKTCLFNLDENDCIGLNEITKQQQSTNAYTSLNKYAKIIKVHL